jgi:hypothetical protein
VFINGDIKEGCKKQVPELKPAAAISRPDKIEADCVPNILTSDGLTKLLNDDSLIIQGDEGKTILPSLVGRAGMFIAGGA